MVGAQLDDDQHERGGLSTCLVVIGAGPIGMYVATQLAEHHRVVVIDQDPASPESTERRTQFLRSFDAPANASTQHTKQNPWIEFRRGCQVEAIDRRAKCVVTQRGERIQYRNLVLALGALPVIPAFADQPLLGVQTAYSQEDFRNIAAGAARGEVIAIIGGGFLAAELAGHLAPKAMVRLCVRGQLLGRYTDEIIARRVGHQLQQLGVHIDVGCEVVGIEDRQYGMRIRLHDNRCFVADRVVLACGLTPRTDLAKEAELTVADGICVDHVMRTSDAHIFAVGDCAESAPVTVRGNVASGINEAVKAVSFLLEKPVEKPRARHCVVRRIPVGQLDFLSVRHEARSDEPQQHIRITPCLFRGAFSITLSNNRLVDCQALLRKKKAGRLIELIEEQVTIDRRVVLGLRMGLIPRTRPANDSIICHCAGVRQSRVVQAAVEYGGDLESVIRATGAGQRCGACIERVSALVEGRRARKPLCAIALSILALAVVAVAAGMPIFVPGESVRALTFKVYALLTRDSVRQLSGYTSVAFMAVALGAIAPRPRPNAARARIWHVICGTLALAALPLHVLGGLTTGYGLNQVLVGPFLICVLLGIVVLLRRSLRSVLWLHSAAMVVLLVAILIHVIDVYLY